MYSISKMNSQLHNTVNVWNEKHKESSLKDIADKQDVQYFHTV